MGKPVKDILVSGRRDRVEIMAAIVAMTQKPSKITHIIGQVSLNYPMLKKYLKTMLGFGLIELKDAARGAEKVSSVCQATEKGVRFLRVYCELLRVIYGDDYFNNGHNLAVACLQHCLELEKRG